MRFRQHVSKEPLTLSEMCAAMNKARAEFTDVMDYAFHHGHMPPQPAPLPWYRRAWAWLKGER
jgi:hypothetical protein